MITLLKRHEIQVLLNVGHTQAEVASLAKVSERSVRRIAAEAAVQHVDDRQERVERRIAADPQDRNHAAGAVAAPPLRTSTRAARRLAPRSESALSRSRSTASGWWSTSIAIRTAAHPARSVFFGTETGAPAFRHCASAAAERASLKADLPAPVPVDGAANSQPMLTLPAALGTFPV